jgi:hypothetical protein
MSRAQDVCLRNHPGLDLYLEEADARRIRNFASARERRTGSASLKVPRCPGCGYFYIGRSKQLTMKVAV